METAKTNTTTSSSATEKKFKFDKFKILMAVLVALLVISLGALGYLYAKYQKVAKQNVDLKTLAVQLAVNLGEYKKQLREGVSPDQIVLPNNPQVNPAQE